MIDVRCRRSALRVVLTGHAGMAREGEDIVCAAASALLCTLCANAERLRALAPEVYIIKEMRTEKGYGELWLEAAESGRATAMFLFDAFALGLYLLAEKYPDKVNITLEK